MKASIPLLLVGAFALITPAVAQTYTLDPAGCSPGGAIYCYAIPGTLVGAQQATMSFWLDLGVTEYNVLTPPFPSGPQFIAFHTPGDLSALGTAHIDEYLATSGVVTANGHTGTRMVSLTVYFSGPQYTGAATMNFSSYWAGGSGKGGGGAGWHYSQTGGTFDVSTSSTASASPIAPTPNPPGMPPPSLKMTTEFHLATRQLPQLLRVQNYSGPPSGCYDYTPVAGPYPCLCTKYGCSQCITWRAQCVEQGSEYDWTYPYYWTQIYG